MSQYVLKVRGVTDEDGLALCLEKIEETIVSINERWWEKFFSVEEAAEFKRGLDNGEIFEIVNLDDVLGDY